MAKIKTKRTKAPPAGFDKIKRQLNDFDLRLKQLTSESTVTKLQNKSEYLFDIFRINFEKSRYVYDLRYKRKLISDELYKYLLKEKYADAALISKWKKQGYENLCCLKCIDTSLNVSRKVCICRLPSKNTEEGGIKCVNCGCHGCSSEK